MATLQKLNIYGPRVLVLESPFNNIRDEVREHPFSRFFRNLPWFDMTIVDPMYENNLRFESDKHIATFPQPVLILHAEDDIVVPYKLGHKVCYFSAFNSIFVCIIDRFLTHFRSFKSNFSFTCRHLKRGRSLGARLNFADSALKAIMDISLYAVLRSYQIFLIISLNHMEMKTIKMFTPFFFVLEKSQPFIYLMQFETNMTAVMALINKIN